MKPIPSIEGGYRCIVADCPWQFSNEGTRAAASGEYKTMDIFELAALPVEDLAAKDAHLYIWHTGAHLQEALILMKAWGFTYKMQLHWVKEKDGKLQIGMGNYFRHCSESLIFGTRGRCPANVHDQLNVFFAERQEHSQKPELLQDKAELVSPGPYLELFARRPRHGWTTWGLESTAGEMVYGQKSRELFAEWKNALQTVGLTGNDGAAVADFEAIDRECKRLAAMTRAA